MEKYCIGIDVDKKTLKVCFLHLKADLSKSVKGSRQFANTPTGYQALLNWCQKRLQDPSIATSYVLEATGVYHEQLAYALQAAGQTVHIVLPLKAKRYLQSLGYRSKTDASDAKGLAMMGCEQQLAVWTVGNTALLELRSLTRQIEAFKQQQTALSNQLEAANHAVHTHRLVSQSLKKMLRSIAKEITVLEQKVTRIVLADTQLNRQYEHVKTLKGVGMMTFAVVVAETNGFALFRNQRQLVCYAGYDVVENQSGQRQGKTKISKKGNTHIRRILHMAAMSAVTHQVPIFKALQERVYERTKIKMKGYVAVQRKLLVTLYTLWKKDEDFNPNYQQTPQQEAVTKQEKGIVTSGKEENKPPLSVPPKGAKKQPLQREMAALDELPLKVSNEVLFR